MTKKIKFTKKRLLLSITLFVIFFSATVILLLAINKSAKEKSEKIISSQKVYISPKKITDLKNYYAEDSQDNTDSSITLEYIGVTKDSNPEHQNFLFYTSATDDQSLVQVNNQAIQLLLDQRLIKQDNDGYSIHYFNNRKIATDYFEKINDKNTSPEEKMILKGGYVARLYKINPDSNGQLFNLISLKLIEQ